MFGIPYICQLGPTGEIMESSERPPFTQESVIAEESIVVPREATVRGAHMDTQVWQARYTQSRRELIDALRQVPVFVETCRQLAPGELTELRERGWR